MFSVFRPFNAFDVFRVPSGIFNTIRQPVFLLDNEGNVLIDSDGKPLTYGFRRVVPQEQE